jgi:hypothetical protein
MNYAIELDITHESTFEEVQQFATEHGCEVKLLEENGPAGGNPLYKFTAESFDMLQELGEQILQFDPTDKIYTEEGMTF